MVMENQKIRVCYQGRKWDAPFTDGAVEMDLSGRTCDYCRDYISKNDDAVWQPYLVGHLECALRSALGDVQHLEGRCNCPGGLDLPKPEDDHRSYREEAKATLDWLINHNQGRFHD